MEWKLKLISAVLAIMMSAPIWFYLLYRVLDAVNATPVMWLLYWVYVPISIVAQTLAKLVEK